MEAGEQASGASSRMMSRAFSGQGLSWAALLLLVVIWGSTFAGLRIGVETISPAWLVTGRMLSGAFFLATWLVVKGALDGRTRAHEGVRVTGRAIAWFGFIGVAATAIPFVMYAHAAETTGSAVMAICNGGTPFATVLLAHVLTSEKLTARRMIGVLMGFAGLVVLVLPEFGIEGGGSLVGILLAIFGAWLYAVGNVATRMAPRIEPAMSSLILIGTGGLATLVYALVMEPFPVAPSAASVIAMVVLGLLPTAFAMFVYVWLIQRAGPVFVSFTTYMSPLWATGLGVMFLAEPLHWSMIGALTLILAGVAVANRKPRTA
jgi:drug/metabolite transporter (DMT)-like permease